VNSQREAPLGFQQELDRDFSAQEVYSAVSAMRTGTAAGKDGILPEFLKLLDSQGVDALRTLCTRILRLGHWPADWSYGLIYPLRKSANDNICDSFRGISLLKVVSKLLEAMALARITRWCEKHGVLAQEQGGFRKGRSTLHQYFALSELVDSRVEDGLPTLCCFVDVKSAYDSVWHNGRMAKLLDAGIVGRMWHVIDRMLSTVVRAVLLEGDSTNDFGLHEGVPQGAVLSPVLYAIYINGVVAEFARERLGVRIAGMTVACLLFADDLVVLAENPSQLRRLLKVLGDYATRWRFKFNASKSGIMVINIGAAPSRSRWRGWRCLCQAPRSTRSTSTRTSASCSPRSATT
jgi:hypothetical protein